MLHFRVFAGKFWNLRSSVESGEFALIATQCGYDANFFLLLTLRSDVTVRTILDLSLSGLGLLLVYRRWYTTAAVSRAVVLQKCPSLSLFFFGGLTWQCWAALVCVRN